VVLSTRGLLKGHMLSRDWEVSGAVKHRNVAFSLLFRFVRTGVSRDAVKLHLELIILLHFFARL
jgi:hypothetical protein